MNTEITGESTSEEFNKWADKLESMSDLEISQEIYNRIIYNSDLSDDDKKILKDSYEYSRKLISQNKPLESNLLKIYLKDVKGYDLSKINLMQIIVLLTFCGIIFTES